MSELAQAAAQASTQASPRRRRRAAPYIFGGILGLHLLLGLVMGLNAPPFESTDEPAHYLFVRYLQAYHRLPVQTKEFMAPRAHHPPGYYALGALISGWVAIPGSPDTIQVQTNPKFGFRVDDPGIDNKAVYIHNGPDERFPFQGQALAVHLIRLVSLALSAIAVAVTYLAAREVRPDDDAFALLATALVAFNPMVVFMAGLVSNDAGALVGGSVAIYLLCRGLRRGFTLARWAGVGVAFGLALLLKSSALVLFAPAGLALLVDAARAAEGAWRAATRRFLAGGLALGLPPAVLAGWWFWRNQVIYGDFTGNAAMIIMSGRTPPSQYFVDLGSKIEWVLEGMVGCAPLGPRQICFALPIYWAAALLAVLALLGLVIVIRSIGDLTPPAPLPLREGERKPESAAGGIVETPRWGVFQSGASGPGVSRAKDAAPSRLYMHRGQRDEVAAPKPPAGGAKAWGALLVLPAVALWLILVANVVTTAAATFVIGETCPSCWAGRYMFPAFTSLAMLLSLGALAWPPPRWRGWTAGALMALSLALPTYALLGLIIPRYNIPPSASANEVKQAMPLDAQVGGVARVLGYRVDATTVHPGGVLAVTVYWHVLARTAQLETVFIHIYSTDTGSIAQRDTYPGLGNYATTLWDPGRTFADTYRLYLPADAPSAPQAMILLGLYDAASGQRLPVTGQDAGPPEDSWVQFGSIAVER